jgi:PAS domain S-box-containing protein
MRMDEALARLAAIVESTEHAIIGRDQNGIITSWNPGAQLLYGYTAEEIIGQSINVLIPEDLREEAKRLQDAITEGKSTILDETIRRRKDGIQIWVSLSASPLKDPWGTINGAAIIARDITEREKTEEALREQAHLLDSAQVFIRNLESRIVFWPKSAEKLYGFTAQEAMGALSHELLQSQFPEPLETITQKLFETDTWEGELTHRRRDGTPIIVLSTWILHRNRKNQPISILENNIDITETRRLEQQLHRSQKMDAIGQLTGGIAHDFNNLLGIVLGNLDLLEDFAASNEDALDHVLTAQRAVLRGADLTRRLLAFARMEDLKPASTLLNSSIESVIAMAKRSLGPEIKITTALDESLPLVFVDAGSLESALLSLVVNARDSMPGGGSMHIQSSATRTGFVGLASAVQIPVECQVMPRLSSTT